MAVAAFDAGFRLRESSLGRLYRSALLALMAPSKKPTKGDVATLFKANTTHGWRRGVPTLATWGASTLSDHTLRYVLNDAGYDVCTLTETHGVPPSFDQALRGNPGRATRPCTCDAPDRAAGVAIALSKQAARLQISSGSSNARSSWVRLRGTCTWLSITCTSNYSDVTKTASNYFRK